MARRRFSDREVIAALIHQGIPITCYRTGEPITLDNVRRIEREHLHELALGGPDVPANCRYSLSEAHAIVTNGSGATSAGSSKHRIAKARRLAAARRPESTLTFERARELMVYDQATGQFEWINPRPGCPERVGSTDEKGYRRIIIDGQRYRAARVAWLLMTGAFPEHQIDHINHIKHDDRWQNLREATRSQQQGNLPRSPKNYSGVRGVRFNPNPALARKPWFARITINTKRIYLGAFATKDEATEAYRKAAEAHFGSFLNQKLLPPRRPLGATP